MDPLVEIPEEHWPNLQELLKKLWPLNVPGYYALYQNMNYPKVKEDLQFKVYCPFGDKAAGFVATSFKDKQEIVIWPISEDTRMLEEALTKTKVIDWSRKICIDTVSSVVMQLLDRVKPQMEFSFFYVGLMKTYFLNKNKEPFKEFRCPPNTYIRPVKTEDICQVNDSWSYKHPDSHRYFSVLAKSGLSYALYSSEDNTILAWVFLNEYNVLAHLYCVEEYRRRGYSLALVKHVVNDQLGKGNDVYAYVVDGNEKPRALFCKLGFSLIDDSCYMYVQKS